MDHGTPFAYLYDGSYAGFLTCIYESYVRKELPVSFSTPEDPASPSIPNGRWRPRKPMPGGCTALSARGSRWTHSAW